MNGESKWKENTMAAPKDTGRIRAVRSSVDLDVGGGSILGIAEFTVEKYEFRNDTTSLS